MEAVILERVKMKPPRYPKLRSSTPDDPTLRRTAFIKAYEDNFHLLASIVYNMTGDHDLTKDVVQETWAAAYKNFRTDQFTHLRLLKNKARQILIDKYRYNKTRSFITFSDEVENLPIEYAPKNLADTEDEIAFRRRMLELFEEAFIDEIDPQCFWLKFRYGYTLAEISEKLGVAKSTLHDRISRLSRDCRSIWQKEFS